MVMDMKNMPKQSNDPRGLMEEFKKLQGDSAKDLGKTGYRRQKGGEVPRYSGGNWNI